MINIQDDCNQVFGIEKQLENPTYFNRNMQQSSNLKPSKCGWQNCYRVFANSTLLTDHISKGHLGKGKSSYDCQWNYCSYTAKQRHHMMNHIRTHTKERPFVCPHEGCDEAYIQAAALNSHIERHHSSKDLNNKDIRMPLYDHVTASLLSADSRNKISQSSSKSDDKEFTYKKIKISHLINDDMEFNSRKRIKISQLINDNENVQTAIV